MYVHILYCIIGTFGQHQLWNIRDHNTYMHPFIPGEILTDPCSLPKTLQQSTQDQPSEEKPKPSTSIQMKYSDHLSKEEVSIYLHAAIVIMELPHC